MFGLKFLFSLICAVSAKSQATGLSNNACNRSFYFQSRIVFIAISYDTFFSQRVHLWNSKQVIMLFLVTHIKWCSFFV